MEYISGNIFIRRMEDLADFAPGAVVGGHIHAFDHTTIVFSGRWHVKKWRRGVDALGKPLRDQGGEEVWIIEHDFDRDGPFSLLIEAGVKHEFTFLGMPVPTWMEPFLAKLTSIDREAFREQYTKGVGKAWCVYSHRTPQGDVSLTDTGWHEAYR